MQSWRIVKLTEGTEQGRFHSHSYYDIPVFSVDSRQIVAYRVTFIERMPTPDDEIEVGLVDTHRPGSWHHVGTSRAWSWQQGPMAQFVPGTSEVVYNDRDGERFISRIRGREGGERVIEAPIYALAADGRYALSLNMARLNWLRPGYGYPGTHKLVGLCPSNDGVYRIDMSTGELKLILSIKKAYRFVFRFLSFRERIRHCSLPHLYWLDHPKISPGGQRFTVKLRWRLPGRGWNDTKGVSLTANFEGQDLHLLARRTSHVIWEDDSTLFLYQGGQIVRYADEPVGRRLGRIAPEVLNENVHIRALSRQQFVFDTPYRESVSIKIWDEPKNEALTVATFTGHRPKSGPFRCDLHPCPAPCGDRFVVTSMQDGGRQLYLVERAV